MRVCRVLAIIWQCVPDMSSQTACFVMAASAAKGPRLVRYGRAKHPDAAPRHSSHQLFHPHLPVRPRPPYTRSSIQHLPRPAPPPLNTAQPSPPRPASAASPPSPVPRHVGQDAARSTARRLQIRTVQAGAVGYGIIVRIESSANSRQESPPSERCARLSRQP